MTQPWIAALFALFIWWFSTGVIMMAVRRADRVDGHVALVIAGVPVLVIGVALVSASLQAQTVVGVYQGFLGALAIWGWIELTFLAGVLTGPRRVGAMSGELGWPRFVNAVSALAYHEVLLLVAAIGLSVVSDGALNQIAIATFLILFLARVCAKLNLFFGVPRINLEFIPARLTHLKTFFKQGPVTLAFPIAITVLTAVLAVCAERLWTAQTDVTQIGFALLTALAALALLEHWLMVIPLPDAKLWRWMLPAPRQDDFGRKTDRHHGL
ncbi:DUF3623 domain-containing protein [Rhodobacteraceae bacterium S2214]|nr:DUF3623 domain-containing protein [Rhodobacteraceae bacterium S2214]